MSAIHPVYEAIENSKDQTELSTVVEAYLAENGQSDAITNDETFMEIAARVGGAVAEVMETADDRWWALEK